jgi:hypothetical protein
VSGRTLAAPAGHQPNIAISSLKGAMLRPNCLKICLAGKPGLPNKRKSAPGKTGRALLIMVQATRLR